MYTMKLKEAFLALVMLGLAGCGGGGGGGTPPVVDTTAPTVAITAPASNASVNGVTSVSASADDNIGVSRVEFYLNGQLKGSASAAPYTASLDTSSLVRGSYTLTAKAFDVAGNVGQSAGVPVSLPIAVAMNTVISGSTALGTVKLFGIAPGEAHGLRVVVTGADIGSVVSLTGSAANPDPNPSVTGSTIILPSAAGFGSGAVMEIHFSNVPSPANLQITLVDVIDANFSSIPLQ